MVVVDLVTDGAATATTDWPGFSSNLDVDGDTADFDCLDSTILNFEHIIKAVDQSTAVHLQFRHSNRLHDPLRCHKDHLLQCPPPRIPLLLLHHRPRCPYLATGAKRASRATATELGPLLTTGLRRLAGPSTAVDSAD